MTAQDAEGRAPDSTPVEPRHVDAMLEWYGTLVKLPSHTGWREQWYSALARRQPPEHMTLGELRNGIRRIQGLFTPIYLEPVQFWHLCKGMRSPEDIERWRKLRETLRGKSQEKRR